MGLPLRITYKNNDYVYHVNTTPINENTTELEILLNGATIALFKDPARRVWLQKDGSNPIDPDFAQALGRSVSLRFRM